MRRHLTRTVALAALVAATLVGGSAHATTHVTSVIGSHVGAVEGEVTIQFDVTFSGGGARGTIDWSTGDGGAGTVADGLGPAGYLGNGGGSALFLGSRPSGASRNYRWTRSLPSPQLVRIQVTYTHAKPGTYPVAFAMTCCPSRSGGFPVVIAGESVADCTVDPTDARNTITYDPPVTLANVTVPIRPLNTVNVVLHCDAGTAPARGTYVLQIEGYTLETCSGGQNDGDARITGVKSDTAQSVTTGRWFHHRNGAHLFGYPDPSYPQQSGDVHLAGSWFKYEVNLWLDLPPFTLTGTACPGAGAQMFAGHGTIRT